MYIEQEGSYVAPRRLVPPELAEGEAQHRQWKLR
jgi:hypothetical protein